MTIESVLVFIKGDRVKKDDISDMVIKCFH